MQRFLSGDEGDIGDEGMKKKTSLRFDAAIIGFRVGKVHKQADGQPCCFQIGTKLGIVRFAESFDSL
jgi:hypothetical protein